LVHGKSCGVLCLSEGANHMGTLALPRLKASNVGNKRQRRLSVLARRAGATSHEGGIDQVL